MKKESTRNMVAKARERLKTSSTIIDATNMSDDKFPAAQIHTTAGAGREIIKRIAAKEVDPNRCKPWEYHNRDQEWLTNKGCEDLIKSITSNGQMEPGLVRVLDDDPDYDYEIIYGVRRWFACKQIPNQKYLVKVTSADDRQSAVLMHIENSDSKDISESERAFSFLKQLRSGLFKSQDEFAALVNISRAHLSKLLKSAEVFHEDILQPILKTKKDIPIKYAYDVSLMIKKGMFDLIGQEVQLISKEMEEGIEYTNTKIFKRISKLKNGVTHSPEKKAVIIVEQGRPLLTFKKECGGKLILSFDPRLKELEVKKVISACKKIIEEEIFQ